MKKNIVIIMCIAACCLFTGCEPMAKPTPEEIRAKHSKWVEERCELIDITFNGETHEYVKYLDGGGDHQYGSLTHWAGCKYCKNKSNENNNWLLF